MALAMVLSLSVISTAALEKSAKNHVKETTNAIRNHTKQGTEAGTQTSDTDTQTNQVTELNKNSTVRQNDKDIKKEFRAELNEQKKALQQQKTSLNKEKETLEAEYKTLIASGDTAGAEAVAEKIDLLNEKANELKNKIKETINERFMIVKTMYSGEELAKFESAADLIAQMYVDAKALDAGSITVNNNIVKFDAPPYIKGGNTLVPLRAISEQLGAEVSWDDNTQTVTITKEDTIVEFKVNSTTVLVNGVPTEIPAPAHVTSGRTYLPLRFLAETLDFNVNWDGDNEIIDIETVPDTNTTTSNDTTGSVSPVPVN